MKFAEATKFHRKSGEARISCLAALDEAAIYFEGGAALLGSSTAPG
jgi:hypothetical protein